MKHFTDEDIKQLVPEARKFDEGWFLVDADGKLMPFTHALDLLLATRKELKEARERLEGRELLVADCMALLTIDAEARTGDWESDRLALVTEYHRALFGHQPETQAPITPDMATPHGLRPSVTANTDQAPSLAGNRTLDLRGLTTNATQFDQTIWLSKLLKAIRAQLPAVEVIV